MITLHVEGETIEVIKSKLKGLLVTDHQLVVTDIPASVTDAVSFVTPAVEGRVYEEPKKRGRKPASTAPAQAVDRGASSEPASPPPGAAPATVEATLAETKSWMQKVAALETETNQGFARVRKIVMAVTNGKQKISDVDPKDYGAIIEACKKELPS